MKISKKTLLIMGGVFSVFSLGLMFVSAAERNLSKDLNNAVQHINEVKFVFTGKNGAEATLGFLDGNLVKIEAGSGFFISEDNQASFGLMGGDYSSVLGGYKNRKGGTYDVVLGGSGNSVRGSYNSILGGEGNSITGGYYNTIIGGIENKINSKSSLYSVILGGISNMIGSGKSSVVMGTHSSVNGSHSVALGSGSKVEANNSFLWTDGSNSDTLNSDNVFAIIAQSGAVINTDKAHSFAKLTLGGPMIVFSGRTGENIACGAGEGGGILKVVQSDNNQMCMCSCDGTGWNSMFGKGRCRSVCDVSLEPKCGETVTKVAKNDRGSVYAAYSGTCERGVVVEGTGAYLVTKDNKVHWSCQSEDGLVVGCSGSVEGGYLTVNTCGGIEPTGPGVIKGSPTYLGNDSKNWQGNDNINGTPGACQWKCETGYEIDFPDNPTMCRVKVLEKDCTGTLPTNEEWVNNKFTQTWNGSEWTPGNVEISYWDDNNTKPCSYKCNTGYDWNGTSCEAKIYQCTGQVPSNAVLVPGSTGGLTIDVERHLYPSLADAGSNKCAYLCDYSNHYIYDSVFQECRHLSSPCDYSKIYYGCVSPATATNTGYKDNKYTWDCAIDGTSEPIEVGCFKCKNGYTWDGSKCVGEEKYTICVEQKNKILTFKAGVKKLPFELKINIPIICNGNPSNTNYSVVQGWNTNGRNGGTVGATHTLQILISSGSKSGSGLVPTNCSVASVLNITGVYTSSSDMFSWDTEATIVYDGFCSNKGCPYSSGQTVEEDDSDLGKCLDGWVDYSRNYTRINSGLLAMNRFCENGSRIDSCHVLVPSKAPKCANKWSDEDNEKCEEGNIHNKNMDDNTETWECVNGFLETVSCQASCSLVTACPPGYKLSDNICELHAPYCVSGIGTSKGCFGKGPFHAGDFNDSWDIQEGIVNCDHGRCMHEPSMKEVSVSEASIDNNKPGLVVSDLRCVSNISISSSSCDGATLTHAGFDEYDNGYYMTHCIIGTISYDSQLPCHPRVCNMLYVNNSFNG